MTDEELMLDAKAGKIDCISVLYDRYHTRLYNFFLQQTHDQSQSKDLTQIVFERVIKYREKYVEQGRFTSWIYTVARNVHMDLYRKKREDLPGAAVIHAIADRQIEVNDDSINDKELEDKDHLKKAMKHLRPEQRELIWLSRYEKLKYAEIAHILGSTEGAVKIKIHRSMKDLKTQFFKIRQHELGR